MRYLNCSKLWQEYQYLEDEREDLDVAVLYAEEQYNEWDGEDIDERDELQEAIVSAQNARSNFDDERLKELEWLFIEISKEDIVVLEDHFEQYVEELLKDSGVDIPAWVEVDWEATAVNLKQDMDSFTFEGEDWVVVN